MKDEEIIRLFFDRDENAITETDHLYGKYCTSIALNILASREDAEECVSDTYMKIWNSIPPDRPHKFQAYIGKITRNIAFNMLNKTNTLKRGKGHFITTLDELSECVSGGTEPEKEISKKEIVCAVNEFLKNLSQEKRVVFIRRYWYSDTISEIAVRCGRSENAVSVILFRLRIQLKKHLLERGYE